MALLMPSPFIDLSDALAPLITRARPDISWRKNKNGIFCERKTPVTPVRIRQHLMENGDALGVCPIREGETTAEIAVLDLDSHKGETSWDDMVWETMAVCGELEKLGMQPHPFRSSGGKGVHIYLIWDTPQDAYSVREFLREAIGSLGYTPGAKGVAQKEIEIFPKQNGVPMGGCGNQFILPLSGESAPLDENYELLPREAALNLHWQASEPVPLAQAPPQKEIIRQRYDGDLAELNARLASIPNDSTNYDLWIQIGMALHAETDGSYEGLALWEEWSARCPDYSGYEQLEYKWGSFRSDKDAILTAGYIKKISEENGYRADDSKDFEDVSEPEENRAPLRYATIRADDYTKRPAVKWLIKNILPRGENMAYGSSTVGKTFALLDMACHIAMGLDWNGHKTTRGKVVYICTEGAGGFTSRLKSWVKRHGVALKDLGDWLTIIPDTPNFLDTKDATFLAKRIKEQHDRTDLVIVDTLAQATAGGDESSSKDMGLALKNSKGIAAYLNCSYLLVHHTGKDETRGARGWSGLKGQLDGLLYLFREGDKRTLWVDKLKDAKDDFGFAFALRKVVVGFDQERSGVASCYVKYEGNASAEDGSSKMGRSARSGAHVQEVKDDDEV